MWHAAQDKRNKAAASECLLGNAKRDLQSREHDAHRLNDELVNGLLQAYGQVGAPELHPTSYQCLASCTDALPAALQRFLVKPRSWVLTPVRSYTMPAHDQLELPPLNPAPASYIQVVHAQ